MFGEFSGKEESHGGLDLSGGDGGALVVLGQTRGLVGDALENVGHERIHDRHGLGGDAGVGVHLLQHLVDVDGEGLLALGFALFLISGWGSLFDDSFLRSFGSGHFEKVRLQNESVLARKSAVYIHFGWESVGIDLARGSNRTQI